MRDKKVIILVVLSVFAAASLIYGISASPKGRVKRPYIASSGSLEQASGQAALSTKRRAKRSKFRSWKRNPFVPTGVSGTASDLALSGIIGSGANLKAMIGDTIVSKGGKIGDNTVVDIKIDRVILNDGTRDFEIKLAE